MAEYKLGDVFFGYIPDDAVEWVNTTGTMSIVYTHDGDDNQPVYEVVMNEKFTDEEIAEAMEIRTKAEIMEALPDAVADLSEMVSDNAIDTTDLQDALAELSEIVSGLME